MPFDPSRNSGGGGGYSNYGNPYINNQMPPPKKSHKGLIITLVVIVVVLCLAIGGIFFASKAGLLDNILPKNTQTQTSEVPVVPEYKEIELLDDASVETEKTSDKQ